MFDIQEELKKLPDSPGVYLMKDDKDEVIYVGKAVVLKNRVRQYFQNSKNHTPKVLHMVAHIAEFEYIVTDSEMEALLLECNLIKKYRPKYNILLKDDKMYPYIKVTVNEDFPRIFMTRKYVKDGAKYYGPITDATAVKETVEMVHKIWTVRKCKRKLPQEIGKERPCLNYHIGQCQAPCSGAISSAEYKKIIEEAMEFISGKHTGIINRMKKEMLEASENLDFEKAASLRDKIKSIESIAEKQKMSNMGLGDCDVIALARAHNEALVQVFFIRNDKLSGREHFMMDADEELSRSQVLTEFVKQFYSGTAYIPREIILETDLVPEEKGILERAFTEMRGYKVLFTVPQRGDKHKLVELAGKNALITFEQFGERMKREEERTKGAMSEIQKALGLPNEIERIEAFDISNTQGFESVGGMVVFENGKAKRSDYRKFKIKTVIGANDYASMEEILTRRLNHALKERQENSKNQKFSKLPDLIMMDGGKIQVHAAENILFEFGLNIPVCGMIKDDRHRTRGIIYQEKEITLPANSEGFKLLTRIQDEVHRFSIEYHRKLRDQNNLKSILDDIPGIGPARRKALLKQFGSIEKIKLAEVDELLEAEGMTIAAAESVYRFFHGQA